MSIDADMSCLLGQLHDPQLLYQLTWYDVVELMATTSNESSDVEHFM